MGKSNKSKQITHSRSPPSPPVADASGVRCPRSASNEAAVVKQATRCASSRALWLEAIEETGTELLADVDRCLNYSVPRLYALFVGLTASIWLYTDMANWCGLTLSGPPCLGGMGMAVTFWLTTKVKGQTYRHRIAQISHALLLSCALLQWWVWGLKMATAN